MKRKFIYTLLLLLSAGCNEFIDVSGRFLNRINDTSKINLNLDLRPGVTVKGRVGADGETGVGVFIEKDY